MSGNQMANGTRRKGFMRLGVKIGCVMAVMQIFFCCDGGDNMCIYVSQSDYRNAEGELCQWYKYAGVWT